MGSSASSALISAAQIPIALLSMLGLNGAMWPQQATLVDNSTYDYIVVGAGTAGCVLARRLAEDRNSSVLAIEAGDDPPITAILAGLFVLLPNSYVDFNYTSTYDDYAARGQNNFTALTAGKMLGGSASLNHFVHTRGTPNDYNLWANISNDDSWRYDNVLPYFIKSERLEDTETLQRYGQYHGTKGPTGITRQPTDEVNKYLQAFNEIGIPTVLDLNADVFVGVTQSQFTLADRKRQTPALTYLAPIRRLRNLYVTKNTRVTKIIFENNVAVAVEAIRRGRKYTFRARKEIILSAGVYNTPQILMLSGIGPRDHLNNFNITVIQDLPVGQALIEQVSVTLVYKVKPYAKPLPRPSSILFNPTEVPFPVLVGSIALNRSQTEPDYQTYNLLLPHDTPFVTLACSAVFQLRNDICDRWQQQTKSRDSFFTVLALLQPKSRGSVRIGSLNPFDDPVITTGFLTNKEDLEDLLRYVKDFTKLSNTSYFQEIGAELVGLDLQECADKDLGSDEYWMCYIRNHASSPYHTTSTCPMGEVVDGSLKVKGIEKLRIVDASVMPTTPHGAPNAAVIMLAEKASDDIRREYSTS